MWWLFLVLCAMVAAVSYHRSRVTERLRANQESLRAAAEAGTSCLVAVVYRTHAICPYDLAIKERLFPDTEKGRRAAKGWVKRMASLAEFDISLDGYGISYAVRPFRNIHDYHDYWRFREDEQPT